eukprot:gene13423-9234_t
MQMRWPGLHIAHTIQVGCSLELYLTTNETCWKGTKSAADGATIEERDASPMKVPTAAAAEPLAHSSAHQPSAPPVPAGLDHSLWGLPLDDEEERSSTAAGGAPSTVDIPVCLSKVIAPDYSGIRCFAVHASERELVVARENGSLCRLELRHHWNIPHFVPVRHTGGCRQRTYTSLQYMLDTHPSADAESAADGGSSHRQSLLAATTLSGQIILYNSFELFPVYVHHRTGGAIWGAALAGPGRLLTAMADGSWHQLRLVCPAPAGSGKIRLDLAYIVPRIPGADRALSVHASTALRVAAGTDDAGNVAGWRLPLEDGGARHVETLWSATLPKGIGLCCCVCTGGGVGRPVVAVGSSAGEVVLLDANHGHLCAVYAQHRGPIASIVANAAQTALFATGWHESLRSYRCDAVELAEWFPAEVKRRTHYHEAMQLMALPQSQLLLSASRDGTLMYAPLHRLFTAPANYVNVTTQQFAVAAEKNVLLHSRYGRVEAFQPDSGMRHWRPLFAYAVHGKYHVSGLWCDAALRAMVVSTDERVIILSLLWKGGEGERSFRALQLRRVEERANLGAGHGVIDCVMLPASALLSQGHSEPPEPAATDDGEDAAPAAAAHAASTHIYLLKDDGILYATADAGAPQVWTPFTALVGRELAPLPRVERLHWIPAVDVANQGHDRRGVVAGHLVASGPDGMVVAPVLLDGSLKAGAGRYRANRILRLARPVPIIGPGESLRCYVGFSPSSQRYICGPGVWDVDAPPAPPSAVWPFPKSIITLPASLPHDVVFFARLPPSCFEALSHVFHAATVGTHSGDGGAAAEEELTTDSDKKGFQLLLLGHFSRGLILCTERQWRMVKRTSVEAAGILCNGERAVILQRNLEKTLESMPMCWKVRRFGN